MRAIKYLAAVVVPGAVVALAIVLVVSRAPAAAAAPAETRGNPQTLLFVRTTPAGAEVRLDGKTLGKSDGLFPVDPGSYKIVVDLEGHQPHEQQITVRDGRITRIELTLTKQPGGAPAAAGPAPAAQLPNDALLNEGQRLYRDWTGEFLKRLVDPSAWQNLSDAEKAAKEKEWLEQLATLEGRARIPAINALAAIGSKKAVPGLLKIAAERVEKDNRDRWMATRALGLLGDQSVVPELVHLTYHYNSNTRWWAQISLVRLTGQNFGRDVAAWKRWWKAQGGKPPISDETVAWATSAEMAPYADPSKQEESDRQFVERAKARAQQAEAPRGDAPQIVATSPAVGATDVDPATTEITVTFDRDMSDGFSWTGGGPNYPPAAEGKKVVWRDRRTCVLPVKLEPGRYYRVGVNSTSYRNFRSADGVPARPSAIYFTTRGADEEMKARTQKPKIVSMSPPNGAKDVDPSLTEIRITFSVPMGGGFSWTGGGPQFPNIPAGKKPSWSGDRKTCVLPVELKPGWEYRLGLNSPSHKNFQSEGGIPVDPVVYTFTTRAE